MHGGKRQGWLNQTKTRADMKTLLEKIGNKKLIAAFESGDMKNFGAIASKLYKKARKTQDKKEFLLYECLRFSRNETTNIHQALHDYKAQGAKESALKAMHDVEKSEKFLSETDPLVRYFMKESAYDDSFNKLMAN
jgi:hypothetical protein